VGGFFFVPQIHTAGGTGGQKIAAHWLLTFAQNGGNLNTEGRCYKMNKTRIQFYVQDDLLQQIDEFAQVMAVPRTAVIMWILRSYFQHRDDLVNKLLNSDLLPEAFAKSVSLLTSTLKNVGESD